MPGYYDIDDILAEEEMVPCQTMFDFSYLSHLNPDTSIISSSGSKNRPKHVLPKDSVFPMPVWAIRNWTDLGFVRITALPKAYRLRAREWLAADPAAVALAPRFFTAGHCLVHLLERSSQKQAQQWKSSSSASAAAAVRKESMHHLENLLQEANALRITLLQVRNIMFEVRLLHRQCRKAVLIVFPWRHGMF